MELCRNTPGCIVTKDKAAGWLGGWAGPGRAGGCAWGAGRAGSRRALGGLGAAGARQGVRHERQAHELASGDTAMLACDMVEGRAATRRQCAQCAQPCTAVAWPGRWMGVLAGSTGPGWCTMHLAQF